MDEYGNNPTIDEMIRAIRNDLQISDQNLPNPANQAVSEGGGGQAEGFELAEEDLIRHASHADEESDTIILTDAGRLESEIEPDDRLYGESDKAQGQG